MLGLNRSFLSPPPLPNPNPSIPRPSLSFLLKHKTHFPSSSHLFAQSNNKTNTNIPQPPTNGDGDGNGNGSGPTSRNFLLNIRWADLLLDPDPDNILAVGLTGLVTWASAQVLWQLILVSLAIVVAAVKYSFIAALLVFILITLL